MKQQPLFDTAVEEPQSQAVTTYSAEFERFWDACPRNRRTGKKAAWKAWVKLTEETPPETIIAAMDRFASSPEVLEAEPRFVPHPSTWLNGRRFEDEVEEPEDEPEQCVYIQTAPIAHPHYRENIPISHLDAVRSRVAREIFNHLRVCDRPFCEACNSRNVRVYRALFLERHGPSRCKFGPPPGQRGEEAIEEKRAEERLLEEFRRRNPGMNPPRQFWDEEGKYAGCQHADCV